ncbi:glycosyltransferase [Piscinibacter sp.]|uniref:glycosyltransferase n=1 Tax=Piscinibacter sp. TaxID=1903157 RepID=UPI002C50251D|nr:glycosyltransferase family 4 protein [Albitalea sp.]HUG23780.1 glycosyltransferase family 4 protein [Albitalea sp.]
MLKLNNDGATSRTDKALFIVPLYACARNTGGGQRTFHLYESLSRFCDLDILLVSQPECAMLERHYPHAFEAAFPNATNIHLLRSRTAGAMPGPFLKPAMRLRLAFESREAFYRPTEHALARLSELMNAYRYDFVVGRYLLPTSRAGALESIGVPVFLDVDDRDDKVIESRIASPTTPALVKRILRRQLEQMKPLVTQLLARFAHVWLASEVDRDEVQHASKSVLPNIPYESEATLAAADTVGADPIILFVGTYSHRVNREGVLHFVDACWPQIRRAVPHAQFRIVGSGEWGELRLRLEAQPGVTVVGTVDDLAAEYRGCAFSVVPLLEGSGTKIKVLESLRYFRTVVAHNHAVRGLDKLRHGESLLVAESDQGMASHCVALLNDPDRGQSLARRGRAVVADEYSLQRFASTVQADIDSSLRQLRRVAA